jgi:oligoribonuclease
MSKSLNLVWLDLEMTGLDTTSDKIIEIATIITDPFLNILAEGPVIAIHQSETCLAKMDKWCQNQHGRSGLIDRVKASTVNEEHAESITLEFISAYVAANKSPLCGNSICQDRRFMHRHMPKLEAYFHYRNLDVSTIKELANRWAPDLKDGFKKENKHRALDDIYESIHELRYYREHFFNHAVFKIPPEKRQ